MKEGASNLLFGASGITAVGVVNAAILPDPSTLTEIGSILIQLAIGVVTLLKLLKRNKDK